MCRKAPDATFRKGMTLYKLENYSEARTVFMDVQNKYSSRSIAALARRQLEQMDDAGLY